MSKFTSERSLEGDSTMSVSNRLRFEVFKRDLFTCQYCGRRPPDVVLNCDHVIPSSKGGVDDLDNLITSCWECNSGKSNIALSSLPESQMQRHVELIAQLTAFNEMLIESQRQMEDQLSYLTAYLCDSFLWSVDGFKKLPDFRSLKVFYRHLTASDLIEAIDITSSKFSHPIQENGWKYFCAICWTKIREKKRDS